MGTSHQVPDNWLEPTDIHYILIRSSPALYQKPDGLEVLGPVSRKTRYKAVVVYIQNRDFKSFADSIRELSVNETKWTCFVS